MRSETIGYGRNVGTGFLDSCDRSVAAVAFALVRVYRRWLSPLKGFRCAYGALHGGRTCSGVALEAFQELPASQAIVVLRWQSVRCRQAYLALARRRLDVLDSANRHLAQFGTLAGVGILGCIPCFPGDEPHDGGGPLGTTRLPIESAGAADRLS